MRPRFVMVSAAGIVAILLALGGIFYGFRAQAEERQRTCESGNEIRTTLLNVINDLKPAGLIRKPGETDDQYQFRQKQSADAYKLLARRLAPRKC